MSDKEKKEKIVSYVLKNWGDGTAGPFSSPSAYVEALWYAGVGHNEYPENYILAAYNYDEKVKQELLIATVLYMQEQLNSINGDGWLSGALLDFSESCENGRYWWTTCIRDLFKKNWWHDILLKLIDYILQKTYCYCMSLNQVEAWADVLFSCICWMQARAVYSLIYNCYSLRIGRD